MRLLSKNLLFTFVVPGTVGVYVPWWIAGSRAVGPWAAPQFLALPLLAAGLMIYVWCIWDFVNFGRATPAPIDPPRRLVVRGLYRHVRNPMYLGVLTVIAGWSVWFQSWKIVSYAFIIAAVFHSFVRFFEEPTLRRLFGTDYEDYCRSVHRWLPRIRPTGCSSSSPGEPV